MFDISFQILFGLTQPNPVWRITSLGRIQHVWADPTNLPYSFKCLKIITSALNGMITQMHNTEPVKATVIIDADVLEGESVHS